MGKTHIPQFRGLWCKNSRGNTMGMKAHFLLSLGGHSKQASDECNLTHDIPFFDATHLPFPHHVHDLISLQSSPRALERKEAQPRFDASFDESMILFPTFRILRREKIELTVGRTKQTENFLMERLKAQNLHVFS